MGSQTIMEKPEDLLAASGAARLVGLSTTHLKYLADKGKIDSIKTTENIRLFRRKDLQALVRSRAENPPRKGRPPMKLAAKTTRKGKPTKP